MIILILLFIYCVIGMLHLKEISDELEATLIKWVLAGCLEAVVEVALIAFFR